MTPPAGLPHFAQERRGAVPADSPSIAPPTIRLRTPMKPPAIPPHRRVLGIETEYGLSYDGSRDHRCVSGAEALFRRALAKLRHLPCIHGGSLWLENGARFYIDCGSHPEYCTPETEDPVDTMRHVLAGDRILSGVLADVNRDMGAPEEGWRLFKCNVDYSGTQNTWACHESYSTRRPLGVLAADLVPHLVSRLIYTGAGGLNPGEAGIEFCLSPRVLHLRQLSSGSSTGARGILHEKNEPLATGGLHRLHMLCGDSVMSHRAGILKVGTTALILTLAEAGFAPGRDLQLADPVAALHQFNRDPALQSLTLLRSGRRCSALEVQRANLQCAQEHLGHRLMPGWAPRLCALWDETLRRLEHGPQGVMTSLDWAIKWALYRQFAQERGFPLEALHAWNEQLRSQAPPEEPPAEMEGFPTALVARHLRLTRRRANRAVGAEGREVLRLRSQLCEAEIKFSRVGGDGLFDTMDRGGQLDHRVPELTDASVGEVMHFHPGPGRARLRSLFVRKYGQDRRCSCDWSTLLRNGRDCFDLSNPFQERLPRPGPVPSPTLRLRRIGHPARIDSLWNLMRRGQYQLVARELDAPGRMRGLSSTPYHEDYLLLWIRLSVRLGNYPRALELLEEYGTIHPSRLDCVLEHVSLCRFQGLHPMIQEAGPWMEEAERLLRDHPREDPSCRFTYHCHKGHMLGRQSRHEEAIALLEETVSDDQWTLSHPRFFARALCDMAEQHRLLNRTECIEPLLQRVMEIHAIHDLPGDFAEYYQVTSAKCSAAQNAGSARQTLLAARDQLLSTGSPVGQARVIALEARLAGANGRAVERRDHLLRLQGHVPGLNRCPLLRRLLEHWDEWTGGAMLEGEKDPFWNV